MANNKVAKKEQSSNIVDISLLLEDAETGHNMSNDDMMIPRLRILQDGSPQTIVLKVTKANILHQREMKWFALQNILFM